MIKIIASVFIVIACCFQMMAGDQKGCPSAVNGGKCEYVRAAFDYFSGEEGERAYIRLPRGMAQVMGVISRPAVQTGEYTFRIDEDYFGKDPKRQWRGITVCLEADGDDEYKSAVQEMTIQSLLPDIE